MSDAFESPVLPEGAPWRCPYCGESYQFQTHPDCLKKALQERDEAREAARAILADRCKGQPPRVAEQVRRFYEKQRDWLSVEDAP